MHRTASVNEISTRYSVVKDEFEPFQSLRLQAINNKQGSDGLYSCVVPGLTPKEVATDNNQIMSKAFEAYDLLIEQGIAREQARNILPLSTYSECYWKIDLHNLFHFLRLRMDSHAQLEIREFANAIANIVKEWVPIAYEAFEDYILNSVSLSEQEVETLRTIIIDFADRIGYTRKELVEVLGTVAKSNNITGREQFEFLSKMKTDDILKL